MKSFIAVTHEIDDVDIAVSEILEQLDLNGKNKLLKNSIGIVSCFEEYVETGVWAAMCAKLPFEVVGSTTIANMALGEISDTMFCLMVLTSDEISFAAGWSAPVTKEDPAALGDLYAATLPKLPGKPSLIISYPPLSININSDFYVESMSEISGGVLNFGTVTVDHNEDYHGAMVLLNGESSLNRYAFILLHGPVQPKFYVGAISDKKIFTEKSIVTAASGNHLQSVNNQPVKNYLKSLGLTENEKGDIVGINSLTLIMDYNDGTKPIIRAMFAFTPDGSVVCGGSIPVGVTLSVGAFDPAEVCETSRRTLEQALNSGKHDVLLMYSCIGRYFALGYDTNSEFNSLLSVLSGTDVNYLAAYSGGEMCPVPGKDGEYVNRNHNNTFIICAL